MLKILQVSDAYYPFPGGVSEHIHYLSLYLRKLGHEVVILTGLPENHDTRIDPYWVKRVGRTYILPPLKVFNLTQLTLTFSPKLVFQTRDFIREFKPNIVHVHGPFAFNLPFLGLHYGNTVVVATFHTAFVGYNWNKIGKVIFKNWNKKVKMRIYVSKTAMEINHPHYPGKYALIPNGIDTSRFSPEGERISFEGEPVILFVGRMEPRKGFQFLLEAFSIVKRELKDAILVACGKGPFLEKFKNMVPPELFGYVNFLGYVSTQELPVYYRSAHLSVFPSVGGETFGIVLLESMASGTPVLASDIPGYSDVIIHGENGLLFKSQDPKSIAQTIITLWQDKELYKKLKLNGLAFSKRFSWETIAKMVERVYYQTLMN